jgi:anti-anti-sigma factor
MTETQSPHLTSHLDRGVLVLTLTEPHVQGDDLCDVIYQELLAAVAGQSPPRAVVDFRQVTTISAAGLRILLNFRRHLRQQGGALILCGLSEAVAEVFFTTNLVSATASTLIPFALAADVAAAVAHLSKTGSS